MHEASAVEAVVRIVDQEVRRMDAASAAGAPLGAPSAKPRVAKVHLVVGEGTGHMEASLVFYFGVLAKGTRAEGAELVVSYVKPRLRCQSCGESFERKRFSFDCPTCGGPGEMTRIGSEFYVDTIELENGG
ncbi:MAG TPA: hydrogenase maturation nickel metallochaperone HypA, partial [Rectinemataceae bacterium]|nr:hydrogenase maturation nickel metallochaperone HypA [Rectinemataceae bacterium]